MKCPACDGELSFVGFAGISLKRCASGCGGVWFDSGELDRFDEKRESLPPGGIVPIKNSNVVIDRNKARCCPRCTNQTLAQHFYDQQNQIEVDQCLGCGGIWLDIGELDQVRDQNTATNSRMAIIERYTDRYRDSINRGEVPKRVAAVFKLLF